MTFKTKYNIGDSLWFIADGKILNLPVKTIAIDYRPFFKKEIGITYSFFETIAKYEMFPQWDRIECHVKNENEVYETKEELIKNL